MLAAGTCDPNDASARENVLIGHLVSRNEWIGPGRRHRMADGMPAHSMFGTAVPSSSPPPASSPQSGGADGSTSGSKVLHLRVGAPPSPQAAIALASVP